MSSADEPEASSAPSPSPAPKPPSSQTEVGERARALDALFRRTALPETIGRYVILDTLGAGGMGTVLRAFDRELDRPIALKVLHDDLDEKHSARLHREAQAMAKLSHPNVVQVYEVGQVQGQTFVAMELVKGKTPKEWMRQDPRPDWRACVEVFVQLGAGLRGAHQPRPDHTGPRAPRQPRRPRPGARHRQGQGRSPWPSPSGAASRRGATGRGCEG